MPVKLTQHCICDPPLFEIVHSMKIKKWQGTNFITGVFKYPGDFLCIIYFCEAFCHKKKTR